MATPVQAVTSELMQPDNRDIKPYPPSFIDRFMDWVEQLPIPYWLAYLALFILHGLFNHVFDWVDGSLPAFAFRSGHFTWPLWLWAPLALMTFLDLTALKAVSNFGPLLDLSPEGLQRLKYELTTMPARGVIISGFVFTCVYAILIYLLYPTYLAKGYGTLGTIHIILDGWVGYTIGTVIFYHTIRQLRLVHTTVKSVKQFNLFRLDPVYAFSVLTSRTGMALIFLYVLTLLVTPIDYFANPLVFFIPPLIMLVLALAAFALPLWVVHQRLVSEKRRLLAEHDQRVESTLARLHANLDSNELGGLDQLDHALSVLRGEHDVLIKIPTWPWRAGLFTGFLSVIVLPMVIFIIQLGIGRWLGK
ncbi:MAG: hypothetical protein WCF84_09235 [Anaerolineae bacterium]